MKFCLIGKNISYSLSKKVHELVYELYDIKDASYEIHDTDSFYTLKMRDYKGFNVTIPYKIFVTEQINSITPLAKKIGGVNTVVNKDGKLEGHNTDYYGFIELLEYYNIDVVDKDIVVLGDGATSKTVRFALEDLGAKSIRLVTRKEDGNLNYTDELTGDVLVNTTPVKEELIVTESSFKNFTTLIDLNYRPFRTKLMDAAWNNGVNVYNGLFMLISQAVKACELWFEREFDTVKVYKEFLHRYINIVFIGFMGSGKTTISKIIGERLGKHVIDLDQYIEEREKRSIPEIFANYGEAAFRTVESNAVNEVSGSNGYVLATGGGVIVHQNNMTVLKENSLVIGLNRDINKILTDIQNTNRPLARTEEEIISLYNDREAKYQEYCDYLINNDNLEETCDMILTLWEAL